MIKHLLALAVAIAAFGAVAKADDTKPTIRAVADEWPPFSGAALPGRGLSLDVISAVFARAGYVVESDVLPWARIMDGARRSAFDVVGSLFLDEELKAFLEYSDPFYATDVRFVQRTGGTHVFTSVEDLRPYSFAVGDGFLYEDEFDRADYLNKVTVTTTLQAMQMVAFGRVDLTLDSVDVVNYAMRALDTSLADQLEFVPGTLTSQNIHMAMRKDFPNRDAVLADFNAALAEMRADGTLDAILQRHVGE